MSISFNTDLRISDNLNIKATYPRKKANTYLTFARVPQTEKSTAIFSYYLQSTVL